MELGATVCRPRAARCGACPVARGCAGRGAPAAPRARGRAARALRGHRPLGARPGRRRAAGGRGAAGVAGERLRARARRARARRARASATAGRLARTAVSAPPALPYPERPWTGRDRAPRLPDGPARLRPGRGGRAPARASPTRSTACRARRAPRARRGLAAGASEQVRADPRGGRARRRRDARRGRDARRPSTSSRVPRPPRRCSRRLDQLQAELDGLLAGAARRRRGAARPASSALQADVRGARHPRSREAPEPPPAAPPTPEPIPEPPVEPEEPPTAAPPSDEAGARLIALNMALGGTPREETARYLAEHFELADPDALLDDVYSRAGAVSATRPPSSPSCASGWPRSPTSARVGGLLFWDQNTMMPPRGADARARPARPRSSGSCTTRTDRPRARPAARRARAVGGRRRTRTPTTRGWSAGCGATSRRPCASRPTSRPRSAARRRSASRPGWRRAPPTTSRASATRSRATSSCATATSPASTAFAHPYDVLLDDFEPGLTTAELRAAVRAAARRARAARRAAAGDREQPRNDGIFAGPWEVDVQRAAVTRIARGRRLRPRRAGAWTRRCTRSPARCRPTDVRLTTRYDVDDFGDGALLGACTSSATASTRRRSTPALLPDDARRAGLARRPRVPEPAVGEHRRALAAVLRAGCCRASRERSRAALGGARRRRALPRRQLGPAVADPRSRPTRRPTTSTSSCASSSSWR